MSHVNQICHFLDDFLCVVLAKFGVIIQESPCPFVYLSICLFV